MCRNLEGSFNLLKVIFYIYWYVLELKVMVYGVVFSCPQCFKLGFNWLEDHLSQLLKMKKLSCHYIGTFKNNPSQKIGGNVLWNVILEMKM